MPSPSPHLPGVAAVTTLVSAVSKPVCFPRTYVHTRRHVCHQNVWFGGGFSWFSHKWHRSVRGSLALALLLLIIATTSTIAVVTAEILPFFLTAWISPSLFNFSLIRTAACRGGKGVSLPAEQSLTREVSGSEDNRPWKFRAPL